MSLKSIMLIMVLLGCILCANPIKAAEPLYVIEGCIQHTKSGLIYIYLVDQDYFKKPLTGLQTITLEADHLGDGVYCAEFRFDNIPVGRYGIRSFQDSNGNGTLDKGMFGPSEPWGMSWQQRAKTKTWPSFEDIAFPVEKDVRQLTIHLN